MGKTDLIQAPPPVEAPGVPEGTDLTEWYYERGCSDGLPLVPVRVVRLQGCHFRIEVEPEIEPDRNLGGAREIARDMTRRVYRRFEAWIGEHPEQWLCTKRRWPDLRKSKWQAKLASNPRLVRNAGAGPRA